jgi:segregation and condensation protein B
VNPEIPRALEAILLVADSPVETALLASLVELSEPEVEAVLAERAAAYAAEERGFQLVRVAGGWRYQTHPDMAPYVERFVLDGQSAKLSAAALETLAIVAYKQPISRAQIAAIRGVNVDGVMRTLLTRGLVEDAGTEEGSGATLYRTTGYFLDRLGIDSLDELPELAPFLPGMDALDDVEMPGSR